jgi:glutaconate CoA-transferase subunit A
MIDKVMSMEEAVSRFVESGDMVFFAGMQHGEPVAAIHEIVRQHIKHLTVVPGLTLTVGMLIAEGLVDKLVTAFVRDLFDKRQSCTTLKAKKNRCYPELVEYSHFGLALGLLAGEMGISFMPTKSLLGSDIERHNPHIRRLTCPFTHEEVAVVEAICPDVGFIHVQRADRYGNAQKWGSLGMDITGINASRKIIVSAEEIVDHEIIQRDPNRTMVPGVRVSAVVEEPWGAYPIHLAGYYDGDFGSYLGEIEKREEEAFEAYMKEYVYGVRNRRELIEKLKAVKGEAYFERLRLKEMVYSEPIGTGVQRPEVQDGKGRES